MDDKLERILGSWPLAGIAEWITTEHHFVIVDFFAAPRERGRPRLVAGGDAVDARWVPLAEVAGLDLVDGLLNFLRRVGTVGP